MKPADMRGPVGGESGKKRRETRLGLACCVSGRGRERAVGGRKGRAGPAPVGPLGRGERMGGFGACGREGGGKGEVKEYWASGQNRERGRGFCLLFFLSIFLSLFQRHFQNHFKNHFELFLNFNKTTQHNK
jgi:hypothetical protein